MKSSCTRVPQWISRRSYGRSQNAATAERISSICAADMRACGGISSARNSTSPRRPEAPSGVYSLSMQNSVRWVLPVMSARMLRNSRSVIQGGTGSCRPDLGERDLQLRQAVLPRLIDRADAGWSGR